MEKKELKEKDEILDTFKRATIMRGDIYFMDLNEYDPTDDTKSFYPTSGILGKLRPCLVLSDAARNQQMNGARVIPLKTEQEAYLKDKKYHDGYIRINMGDDQSRYVVASQARFVGKHRIKNYVCTLKPDKLREVEKTLLTLDFALNENEAEQVMKFIQQMQK